jgi:glycosyltransferase involved in cell wall biosynthesis
VRRIRQVKVCFLSLSAYPTLTNKNLGYAGGAEVEQICLGQELTNHGFDVCFVTYSSGHKLNENASKIEIIETYNRNRASKLNILRKLQALFRALKKANADIYFHESGSIGVLPLFCLLNMKKFVYRIPSDSVVLSKPLSGRYSFTKRVMDILETKTADVVIAQTLFQKRLLKERFKVESSVIKNGFSIPKLIDKKSQPPIVLWVGSISSVKRPHLFLELAKSIPSAHFEMIGGKGEPTQLYQEIEMVARKLSNLRFYGFVPYDKINNFFRRASIFVNTSILEGFPNTFIQAWANYNPVVSLNVDPDDIIQKQKLGFHSNTFKQLISDVISLLNNRELAETMGKNGREYVEKEHDIRLTVRKYIEVFDKIL